MSPGSALGLHGRTHGEFPDPFVFECRIEDTLIVVHYSLDVIFGQILRAHMTGAENAYREIPPYSNSLDSTIQSLFRTLLASIE
jgi:hypothetical protein